MWMANHRRKNGILVDIGFFPHYWEKERMRENMSHSVHVWLVTAKISRPCQKMIEIPFPISPPNIRQLLTYGAKD
jgi:hypothetical protein